jgi:hypothetical protein
LMHQLKLPGGEPMKSANKACFKDHRTIEVWVRQYCKFINQKVFDLSCKVDGEDNILLYTQLCSLLNIYQSVKLWYKLKGLQLELISVFFAEIELILELNKKWL